MNDIELSYSRNIQANIDKGEIIINTDIRKIDISKLNCLSYNKNDDIIERIYGDGKSIVDCKYLVIQTENTSTTMAQTTIFGANMYLRYIKSNRN